MEHIMSRPVIVGKLEDSIQTVASIMKRHDIGFLPIAKGNKIVGVITDRDLVIGAVANKVDPTSSIENYITHRVVYIDQNASIEGLLELMATYQIKRVLITNKKEVVGVITLNDLLKHINPTQFVETLQKINKNDFHETQEDLEIDSFYL